MSPHQRVIEDLAAEVAELGEVLQGLAPAAWDTPTPAPGWAVRDQVAHLVMFDERCTWSIADPGRFVEDRAGLAARGWYAEVHNGYSGLAAEALQSTWSRGSVALLHAGRECDPKVRCEWYGPSMSATSMLTARLMETWAHGQDIIDALGQVRTPTDRLRHVAHIAVNARPFAFVTNGRPVPASPVRVELRAPDGDTWTWGESSTDIVRGDALGFCLAATQRRHPDDCALEVTGDAAREWVSIIQAFAGPPGAGREPGQFA